mmetsp:Transcript_6335/g.20400  ORF Transcript_6335/g.20400 Transcript_6335/m.20400 type:complete len:210 (-) Transcript_6335:481-1110(-)
MTSPISILSTGISMGSAPESSMVLKKIGAITLPMHTPPARLLGTPGMSSPMYHRMELVALFREEPVPTTSPMYASGCPFCFSSSICANTFPFSSLIALPARSILSIARACRGMSGRDQASGAGERSSVLVSPATLKTVTVIFSGTLLRDVNHSALAQDSTTSFALALPAFILSSTSKNASNIRMTLLSAFAAASASSGLSRAPTRCCTL